MRALLGMIFVTAVLVGLFALIKFMVYGVSEDFGWGVLAGGLLMAAILIPGFYFDGRERERKLREELSAPHRFTRL